MERFHALELAVRGEFWLLVTAPRGNQHDGSR
jgi:hypothetical protein